MEAVVPLIGRNESRSDQGIFRIGQSRIGEADLRFVGNADGRERRISV